MSTLTFTDASVLTEVDLSIEPACDVEKCSRSAALRVRFGGCRCHALVCQPCFDHDERVWARGDANLPPGTAVSWRCPMCEAEHVATAPGLWGQIVVLAVPL